VSPAFARVAAGQKMPADLKYIPGAPIVVIPSGPPTPAPDTHSIPTSTGTPLISGPMPSAQPLVGSGGVVYPAGAAMPGPSIPAMSGPAVVPLALYTPSSVGQQTILLVNGPNGPQYVIAEVMGSAPAPVPAMTGAPVMPASTVMPAPAVPPTGAVVPDQAPAPTLNPPPPAAIPVPPMPPTPAPAVVPVAMGVKAPETVTGVKAPTGPILPAAGVSVPSLESPGPFRAAKAPPAPGIEDEPIPPAPAFVLPKK
jgi:hypothetical protein